MKQLTIIAGLKFILEQEGLSMVAVQQQLKLLIKIIEEDNLNGAPFKYPDVFRDGTNPGLTPFYTVTSDVATGDHKLWR